MFQLNYQSISFLQLSATQSLANHENSYIASFLEQKHWLAVGNSVTRNEKVMTLKNTISKDSCRSIGEIRTKKAKASREDVLAIQSQLHPRIERQNLSISPNISRTREAKLYLRLLASWYSTLKRPSVRAICLHSRKQHSARSTVYMISRAM
jgi:hypothetical protein